MRDHDHKQARVQSGDHPQGFRLSRHFPVVDPAHNVGHDRKLRRLERTERGGQAFHARIQAIDPGIGPVVSDDVHQRQVHAGFPEGQGGGRIDKAAVYGNGKAGAPFDFPDCRDESRPRKASFLVATAAQKYPDVALSLQLKALLDEPFGFRRVDHGGEELRPAVAAIQAAGSARDGDRRGVCPSLRCRRTCGKVEGDPPAEPTPRPLPRFFQNAFQVSHNTP